MAYRGYRPDLLTRIVNQMHLYNEWTDAKRAAEAMGEPLDQFIECVRRLELEKTVKLRDGGGIVSFRSVEPVFAPYEERPRKVRICSKCGKPIKRRHSQSQLDKPHLVDDCHLECVRRVMED